MGTTCVSRPPPRGPPDEEWQGPDPLEGHQLRSSSMSGEEGEEGDGAEVEVEGEGHVEGGGDSVAHAADGTASRAAARIARSDASLASRAARASRTVAATAAAAAPAPAATPAAAPVGARAADATLEEMGAAGASGDAEGEGETVRALTRAAKKLLLDAGPE